MVVVFLRKLLLGACVRLAFLVSRLREKRLFLKIDCYYCCIYSRSVSFFRVWVTVFLEKNTNAYVLHGPCSGFFVFMKRTIQCTILCILAINSAFAGRPVPGELDELRPANRAILMFLRLNDVEGDVRYWLYEECLDSASNSIVEHSLIDWLMYHMRDSLERFREIVTNQQPFSPLMNDGIYAAAADFTDEEYERMHDFFRRYVDFVERVLNPWRDAWERTHRNVQLQGAFWTLRMGDVLKFRTYAQAYVQMLPGNEGEPEGLENYAHANIRIGLIDQGPLNALIAMVIMDNMLNGMYGVWAELRDALNEQDYDDMLRYRTPQQAGQEDPEDAVHRRLAVLNALLQVDELVPIEGVSAGSACI